MGKRSIMVYVDDMNAKFGRMVMCHMIADTTPELLEMADKIGVNRKWIQYPDSAKEHFDICLSKKAKAIKFGAKEITWRQLGEITIARLKSDNEITLINFTEIGQANLWAGGLATDPIIEDE